MTLQPSPSNLASGQQRQVAAVLLLEQKVDDALRFAQDVVVLERGEVVYSGHSAALRERVGLLEQYVGVSGEAHV